MSMRTWLLRLRRSVLLLLLVMMVHGGRSHAHVGNSSRVRRWSMLYGWLTHHARPLRIATATAHTVRGGAYWTGAHAVVHHNGRASRCCTSTCRRWLDSTSLQGISFPSDAGGIEDSMARQPSLQGSMHQIGSHRSGR